VNESVNYFIMPHVVLKAIVRVSCCEYAGRDATSTMDVGYTCTDGRIRNTGLEQFIDDVQDPCDRPNTHFDLACRSCVLNNVHER
jgi:hypothetical protein